MSLDAHELACLHQGLSHFRAGDYFAAHDDWEEVWQGLRGSPRLFWQSMIQLVVGAYHYSNGNMRGCQGQWQKALQKCEALLALESFQAALANGNFFEIENVLARGKKYRDRLPGT